LWADTYSQPGRTTRQRSMFWRTNSGG
jgi:hypothetical protein